MSSHEAFYAAVMADPDNLAPRLVYADWLEERGDPRGEFIRLQYELIRLPCPGCGADDCVLRRTEEQVADACPWRRENFARSQALLFDNGQEWAEPVRQAFGIRGEYRAAWGHSGGKGGFTWFWRAGFVGGVQMPYSAYFTHQLVRHLFSRLPVTSFGFRDRQPAATRRRSGGKVCHTWFVDTAHSNNEVTACILNDYQVANAYLAAPLMPIPGCRRCNYNTETAALAALSEHVVRINREDVRSGRILRKEFCG